MRKMIKPSISPQHFTRRDFLKLGAASMAGLGLRPLNGLYNLPVFPEYERLGRVTQGFLEVKSRPDPDSETVRILYEDTVVPWLGEVIGDKTTWSYSNQRWVETLDGYLYSPHLQPVKNIPNQAVEELKPSSLGPGMWMEVTVPFVDAVPINDPYPNFWVDVKLQAGQPLRLYYSQIFWVDRIRKDDNGRIFYRVNPNYYGGFDMLWAAAEAFRPISQEEIAPINPDVENKRVVVDVNHQILSCYEGNAEVYFCRVSTGAKFTAYGIQVDHWTTPLGRHIVTRKYISLQMTGSITGAGWDLPGIGWATVFATGGVAVHSTFWHNNFGDLVSRGCVNVLPKDAKWIFRWVQPQVAYDPGMYDYTVSGGETTRVEVIEG
jgi:lipoprotein-anchoring transpeptidase ErfK/SrfK